MLLSKKLHVNDVIGKSTLE